MKFITLPLAPINKKIKIRYIKEGQLKKLIFITHRLFNWKDSTELQTHASNYLSTLLHRILHRYSKISPCHFFSHPVFIHSSSYHR